MAQVQFIMGENMSTVQVHAVVNRFGHAHVAERGTAHRCAICGGAQEGTSWIVLSSMQAGYLDGVPVCFRTVCRDCAKPRVASQTP